MIVRGNSLAPLIDSGQEVEVLFGYYDCYPVCKEEVSLLKYAGNETYLIKIIKGLPGDEFKLVKNNRRWNLYINGSILKNSEGKEYFLSERDHQMLSLYERDYNNKIPKNVYLVLGNKETGSLDSTRFGLIDKSNIVAKVEL
jgi:signal peptidase I